LPRPARLTVFPYTTLFRSPFGGEVIADLLLGAAAPTGRLPMTLPSHPAVLPLRHNDRQSAAASYQDVPDPILFDVGHGLRTQARSEEHTSELQSRFDLVCR